MGVSVQLGWAEYAIATMGGRYLRKEARRQKRQTIEQRSFAPSINACNDGEVVGEPEASQISEDPEVFDGEFSYSHRLTLASVDPLQRHR
jgi:hypothetical protein